MKKRILLVTSEFPPQPGGIGNHAYNVSHQLSLHDYDVSVLADQRSNRGTEEVEFDATLQFKLYRVPVQKFRIFMYFHRLYLLNKLVRNSDIIMASGKFSLWGVAFFSFLYNKCYIAIIHGTEVNFKNNILRYSIDSSLKRFKKIIAVSHHTKSLIGNLNLSNVFVIPNGYNHVNWATPIIDSKELQTIDLITVGNVTDRKGQLNVIQHLPVLLKVFPKLHYHCVGIPTQKDEFLNVARILGVDKHITFYGRLSHEKLIELVRKSSINIMLSTPTTTGDIEGFGIALIEANALGVPAIGSNNCGIEDAIDNYASGILINPKDSEALIEAIDLILSNYSHYQQHSLLWASQHRWDILIKDYIEILRTCD